MHRNPCAVRLSQSGVALCPCVLQAHFTVPCVSIHFLQYGSAEAAAEAMEGSKDRTRKSELQTVSHAECVASVQNVVVEFTPADCRRELCACQTAKQSPPQSCVVAWQSVGVAYAVRPLRL
jgi:hypothetical protein